LRVNTCSIAESSVHEIFPRDGICKQVLGLERLVYKEETTRRD
jgi:hypothetical protein